MALVKIRGEEYEIDVTEEVDKYEWEGARWSCEKLIAKSPFRVDNSPSFFLSLEGEYAGTWGDSGSTDEYYSSGGFIKLISLLEGRDYAEVADELITKYSTQQTSNGGFTIPHIAISQRMGKTKLDSRVLYEHRERSTYLYRRGINYDVQAIYDIRTHKTQKAVAIPWRNIDGSLASIKYRRENDKKFWYEKEGATISKLVYGLNYIYDSNEKEVVICESEIDAMSWRVCGRAAIALGGSNLSPEQADLIRKSPIECIIMSLDKDEPGRKLGRQIIAEFRNVYFIRLPHNCKDANDALNNGYDLGALSVEFYADHLFDRNA